MQNIRRIKPEVESQAPVIKDLSSHSINGAIVVPRQTRRIPHTVLSKSASWSFEIRASLSTVEDSSLSCCVLLLTVAKAPGCGAQMVTTP